MDEIEAHTEIARLESEIEILGGLLASCRKIMLAGKLAMAAAGLWFVLSIIGIVAMQPLGLILAIAAAVGGVVAYGSNASTAQQSKRRLAAAEAQRDDLINRMALTPIEGEFRLH